MLESVQKLAPTLYPYVCAAYSSPSNLVWEDKTLPFLDGAQQEDPICSLLFSRSTHQLCSCLESEMCVFFQDDCTLGGSNESVMQNLLVGTKFAINSAKIVA